VCFWGRYIWERSCGHLLSTLVVVGWTGDCIPWRLTRDILGTLHDRGSFELYAERPLGRPRRRWEDNIKLDLQEVRGGCGDWMELAQDRDMWRALVNTERNLGVPKMWGISWLAAEPVNFSRKTLLYGVSK